MAERTTRYELVNIPIDPSYTHILAFSTYAEREMYFNNQPVRIVTSDNKRWKIGEPINVPYAQEDAIAYNYVRISNPGDPITYYAFIIGRISRSAVGTTLLLEFDWVQTYYFYRGINIPWWWNVFGIIRKTNNPAMLPADGTPSDFPVPLRRFIAYAYQPNTYYMIIYSNHDITRTINSSTPLRSAVMDGVNLIAPPYIVTGTIDQITASVTTLVQGINAAGAKIEDWILGAYMIPANYVDMSVVNATGIQICTNLSIAAQTITLSKPEIIDGYVPYSQALFNQDYTTITVNNGEGTSITYRYDEFTNETPMFYTDIDLTPGYPCLMLYPINLKIYNDVPGSDVISPIVREHIIKINNPMACSIGNNDNFTIWQAQTQNSRAVALDSANFEHDEARRLRTVAQANVTANGINNLIGGVGGLLNQDFGGAIGSIAQGALQLSGGGGIASTNPNDPLGNWVYQQSGLEAVATADANVYRSALNTRSLIAGWRDMAITPPSMAGSDGYGGRARYSLYGFRYCVSSPTAYYAEMIDKQMLASGNTINKTGYCERTSHNFDFYEMVSTQIPQVANLPIHVRNLFISLLERGIYLWHVRRNTDTGLFEVDSNFSVPYGTYQSVNTGGQG